MWSPRESCDRTYRLVGLAGKEDGIRPGADDESCDNEIAINAGLRKVLRIRDEIDICLVSRRQFAGIRPKLQRRCRTATAAPVRTSTTMD
jgi:hypothetical protein